MRRKKELDVGKKPTAKDFDGGAIQEYVLSQAIQHPLTIFPLVLGAAGVLAGFFVTPIGFLVAVGGGAVSLGSGIYNYFIRGEQVAKERVESLRRLRQEYREQESEDLEQEFLRECYDDGAKEARELRAAYEKLNAFLEEQSHGERPSLSAVRFRIFAEDSYEEGVRLQRRALNIFRAIQAIDEAQLRRDLKTVERDMAKVEKDSVEWKALDQRRANHQRRLDLLDQRRGLLVQLLTDSDGIETALETAYLELVNLVGTDAELAFTTGTAKTRLEQAVAAAKRTEERLRGLDSDADPNGDMYLEAGRKRTE